MTDRAFSPIAERDLVLMAKDYQLPVHVAIGAPYPGAKTEGMEHYAGCQVLTCDDEDLAVEVVGADTIEALEAATRYIQIFLLKLAADGELRHKDGSRFDPSGSPLIKQFDEFVNKKVASRKKT